MVQIFISYSRNDNALPPDARTGKGFVSYLHEQLLYEFKQRGQPRPKIWRDTFDTVHGAPFEGTTKLAVAQSDILFIVLTRNWLESDWCKWEIDHFAEHWKGEGEDGIRQRIVFAATQHIELLDRPALLQGKQGFDFFYLDPEAGPGQEKQFYRGDMRDPRGTDRIIELGQLLWQLARKFSSPPVNWVRNAAPASFEAIPVRPAVEQTPTAPSRKPAGTIYVAKPAADMRSAYNRIVTELKGRHFVVVPDPTIEIPIDSTAIAFVDAALAEAELSVHLLGDKLGYTPEDEEPIVKLQLMRAAVRAGVPPLATACRDFCRLVWAPRRLTEEGTSADALPRDPLAVLAARSDQLRSDKIESDNLSKFVDFLVQQIDRTIRSQDPSQGIEAETRVYVYHREEDSDYALQVGQALEEWQIEPVYPSFQGDPADLTAGHRNDLRECNAVVLCWGRAPDTWVKATARELRNWRDLGRNDKFAVRGLIAAPPPGGWKKQPRSFALRSEIDIVLDLTGKAGVPVDALDPLIRAARQQSP